MNPVGEFRSRSAEGATRRQASGGETHRLKYYRGMHLWRESAHAEHRRGKPLINIKDAISQVLRTG